jgi:predicted ribosome quality control (RQC) complex YloA/Tae2 family protein
MKNEMSAFDICFIVKELQKLQDAKIEKIFHSKINKNELLIRFYAGEQGKLFLKINVPGSVYLTSYKNEFESLSGFGAFLRKHLLGSRLINISQKDFERVLIFDFETRRKGEFIKNQLVVELFGQGNIILKNDEDKILGLLFSQRWKDRHILPGKKYVFPASQFDPLHSNKNDFHKKLKESKMSSIVKSLATDISLGGQYAEEVCKRAKIDKTTSFDNLSEEEIELLYVVTTNFASYDIKGSIYKNSITPFIFDSYDSPIKTYDSFCEALDEKLTEKKQESEMSSSEKKFETKLNKIENVLHKQQEMLKQIETDADKYQEMGEAIYLEYQLLNNILVEIIELRKTKSWSEIKDLFKAKHPAVKINEKNNELIVDL